VVEFDYPGWVARALAFTSGLGRLSHSDVRSTHQDPRAAEADIRAVERALGRTIPAPLRTFFAWGTSGLDCGYVLAPAGQDLDRLRGLLPDETRIFGGGRIGPVSELPDFSRAVREWAEETWVAESPAERFIWDSSFPFTRLDNGDYLALDLRTNDTDPPVVYLNHDDESFLLASDFAAFLGAWERLGYIGPEHWLLREFIGADGYLDPESDRASRLRALFAS
jgi:hypothetical protein